MKYRHCIPLLMLAAAAACDRPAAELSREPVTVFATIYPLAQIAREVGGDDVRVDWLVELGRPIDGFTMTRRERDRMTSTDFAVCDGYRRTEVWAAPDLAQRQETGRVISVAGLPISGDDKMPGEGFLYLDPLVARQLAFAIADALVRSVPEHGPALRDRAKALVARIDAVTAGFPKSEFGPRKMIVLAPTFAPLLARCGVNWITFDRDVYRLTEADLIAVKKAAMQAGARVILLPFDLPPGAVSRIERSTGLQAFAIDATGYTGFAGHDTYVGMLQFNLEQLRSASKGN